MAATKKNVKNTVSKKELERAQNIWDAFSQWMKLCTIGVVICLIALAAAFIR